MYVCMYILVAENGGYNLEVSAVESGRTQSLYST